MARISYCDTVQTFAQKVLRLLSYPDEALKIGENARRLVEQKYAWEILLDKMDDAYSSAVTNANNLNVKN